MANLTAQTTATLKEHAMQSNVSLQQLVANNAQLHQQQQAIMNQMAMMSLRGAYQGAAAVLTPQQTAQAPPQIYLPPALPHHQQGYYNTPQLLEGVDAWRDEAVDAVTADADADAVEAVQKCPYHTSEGHSWSHTSKEWCSKDNMPPAKCIQAKLNGT